MDRFLGPTTALLLHATGTSVSISWDLTNGAAPWLVAVSALGVLPLVHSFVTALWPADVSTMEM